MNEQPPVVIDDDNGLNRLSSFDGVLWRRIFAYLLDLVFAGLICLPLGLFLVVGGFFTLALLWAPLPFLWAGVNVGYYVLQVGGRNGATWGQRLMRLRALSQEGTPPQHFQALLQIFLFYISVGISYGLVLLAGLFNARGRLAHDFFSGVIILKST